MLSQLCSLLWSPFVSCRPTIRRRNPLRSITNALAHDVSLLGKVQVRHPQYSPALHDRRCTTIVCHECTNWQGPSLPPLSWLGLQPVAIDRRPLGKLLAQLGTYPECWCVDWRSSHLKSAGVVSHSRWGVADLWNVPKGSVLEERSDSSPNMQFCVQTRMAFYVLGTFSPFPSTFGSQLPGDAETVFSCLCPGVGVFFPSPSPNVAICHDIVATL